MQTLTTIPELPFLPRIPEVLSTMRVTGYLFLLILSIGTFPAPAAEEIPLSRSAFVGTLDDWTNASTVTLDPMNPRQLAWQPGGNILVAKSGRSAHNLVTRETFTDVEVSFEFLIARGSNAGIKLMSLYEIQILDSHGKKELTGSDNGGIYPRGEQQPRYHVIDKGVPPRVNASRPAGEWQSMSVVFRAPRFESSGKKVENARFLKVLLNDHLVQENEEVLYPTGNAWRLKKEVARGPILFQGDHGPIAFRNIRVRSTP